MFLPEKSQGQRSLVGCHLWGRTELDMTEVTQQHQQHQHQQQVLGTQCLCSSQIYMLKS